MKARPLMTRSAGYCSPVRSFEQTPAITWKFDAGGSAVFAKEPEPVRAISDRELAKAAYTQAVALYDSCVQYALATGGRSAAQARGPSFLRSK
jgi:hypothetical protein